MGRTAASALVGRAGSSLRGAGACLLILVVIGCTTAPVPPPPAARPTPATTAAPTEPSPTPTPTHRVRAVGPLALEECNQLGYIPCEHQATILRIPIAGTGVALTYSSERVPGRLDRPAEWTPADAGLGGWSLDVLQHYDATNRILLSGDGTWGIAEPTSIGGSEYAAPSFDGRLAYVFDVDNRHSRTVDAILGVDLVTFAYDDQGRLASAKGSLDSAPIDLTVERTRDGIITGLIGAGGSLTRVSTDGAGHLGAITHPDGGREGLIADPQGLITAYVDPSSGVTRFEYDNAGRLAAATDPDGVTLRYESTGTSDAIEVRVSLPLGGEHIHRARQLDTGMERSYVAPGGPTTTLIESLDGQRAVALPSGTRLTIGASPDARWGSASPILTPVVEERPDGVVRRTEIERVVQQSADNPLQLVGWSQTTTINDDAYIERYDPLRRAMSVVDPMGREQTTVYDERGRVIAYTTPGQPAAAFAYDEHSRLASSTLGSGANAATTTYLYGDDGRVTMTRQDGATEVLVVDAVGRVVQQTAGDGSSLLSSFDAAGRMISIRPGAAQATTLGHSRAGRPTAVVAPALPDDTSYERRLYDDAGRLATVAGPGARQISMSYDEAGQLLDLLFDRGTISAQYDPATGRPVAISAPGGVVTTYRYVGGLRSGIAWSGLVSGDVTLEFDANGRAVGETVDSAGNVRSTYDRAGALTSVGSASFGVDEATGLLSTADLGAARLAWQYDANGRVTSATATASGSVLLALQYERDTFGRTTRLTEASPSGARSTGYRYDYAGRLAAVTLDDVVLEEYAYDGAGNRVAVTGPGTAAVAEYDARNRLSRWEGVAFDYEQDGTLARREDDAGVAVYDFDDLGALSGVVLPDGDRIEYVVDSSGRRMGRLVNGELVGGYLYRPDGHLVAEVDGTGSIVARFAYDGTGALVSIERDGRTFLVVTDQLGSPKLVVDSLTGEIAQTVDYDAWGQVISDSNPGFQPFGLAGGLRDRDTGLVHFGAREYDPTIGRWVEADPIGFQSSDSNLYAYAGNDPVNRSDPSGLGGAGCLGTVVQKGQAINCADADPDFPYNDHEPGSETLCDIELGCYICPPPPGDCYPYNDPNAQAAMGRNPEPEPEPSSSAPGPPKPGTSGGGFTCIGICITPGGGICVGYCSSGDPHIRTADRLPVGFQGAGEYLMINSADGSVVIQARQEPPGDLTVVTITTAIAASVAGERVGVYLEDDGVVSLRVGGQVAEGGEVSRALPNGGSVVRHGTVLLIEWPDGSRLTVSQQGSHLDYGFVPDPAVAPTLTGLMGTPDGDVTNDLVSRDGALILDPAASDFFEQVHRSFGDSWRISQEESLFDYGPGESTATFTLPGIPQAAATTDAVDPAARAAAEELCRAVGVRSEPTLSDCIVDVGLTGDPSYAASAAAVEAATQVTDGIPQAASTLIDYGSAESGLITSPAEVDHFAFEASAGDTVYLDALGSCIDGLSWSLVRPGGSTLAGAVSCVDIGRQGLAEPGTYTIEIASNGVAIGVYAFSLARITTSAPIPIVLGDTISAKIDQVGDQPRFVFDSSAGQTVFIDARGSCVEGLQWRLLGPSGAPLAVNPACVDLGRETLAAQGTYTIEVYSTEAVTGPFAFTVFEVPPPRESTIAPGDVIAGEIAAVGERHRYTFDASVGQVVTLDAMGACVDGLVWKLLGPAGEGWAFGGTCADLVSTTLASTGVYTIEVYSDSTTTGAYRFQLRAGG